MTTEWACPVCGTSILARIYRCSVQGRIKFCALFASRHRHEGAGLPLARTVIVLCMASGEAREQDTASESAA